MRKHRIASALIALVITASSFGSLSVGAAQAAPVSSVGSSTTKTTVSPMGIDQVMCYFLPRFCNSYK